MSSQTAAKRKRKRCKLDECQDFPSEEIATTIPILPRRSVKFKSKAVEDDDNENNEITAVVVRRVYGFLQGSELHVFSLVPERKEEARFTTEEIQKILEDQRIIKEPVIPVPEKAISLLKESSKRPASYSKEKESVPDISLVDLIKSLLGNASGCASSSSVNYPVRDDWRECSYIT